MLPRAVENVGSWLGRVRPVRGEDLVCLASEQQLERLAHELAHPGSHLVVPVADGPSAVLEAAALVRLGTSGTLHHAVEREERADDKLAHFFDLPSVCPMAGSSVRRAI